MAITPEAQFLAGMYHSHIPGAKVRQIEAVLMGVRLEYGYLPEDQFGHAVMLAAINTYQRDQEVRAGRSRWFSLGAPVNWFASVLGRMVAKLVERQQTPREPAAELRYNNVFGWYVDQYGNRFKDREGQIPVGAGRPPQDLAAI